MKNCPICQKPMYLYISRKDFKIYKCRKCGFGQTLGADIQIGDYHRDSEYDAEESLFRNIFLKRFNLIYKYIKSGEVLEIGCSTGIMLSIFRENGFSTTGVELSKKAASIARARGIEVINKPFEKIEFSKKFDLIIMNHTLEHLENPVQVIDKCRKLLKPKGILYIDLPNFDSFSLKFQKSNWPLLLPKEHLWHFTEKSFKEIFDKMNFKILSVEKASGVWDFNNPGKELFTSLTHMKKRFFSEFFTMIPTFFLTKTKKGTDLMVIARKK